MSESVLLETAQDAVTCGFIKAKFPLCDGLTIADHPFDRFTRRFNSRRLTWNFVYIAMGHSDLPDNETAIEYINKIESLGGKITRLDFTVDLLTPFDFTSYYDVMCGSPSAGTPTLITSPGGDTVYIGKRSSARMLRIYDKRSEIKARKKVDIGMDLTRVELEVKRDLVQVYKRLFINGDYEAILKDIADRYSLPSLAIDARRIKPQKIADRIDGPMAFVYRYRRIIKDAYLENAAQFYETIGVNK